VANAAEAAEEAKAADEADEGLAEGIGFGGAYRHSTEKFKLSLGRGVLTPFQS
jgi:hypothetical protein